MHEKFGPTLAAYLESAPPDDTVYVSIRLVETEEEEDSAADGEQPAYQNSQRVIEEARLRAAERQSGLLSYLSSVGSDGVDADGMPHFVDGMESFWINNTVSAQLSLNVLDEIAARDEVALVELNSVATLEQLLDADAAVGVALNAEEARVLSQELLPVKDPADSRISWNVRLINAPVLWDKGLTGEGVVVALIDTGVDYRHPDLSGHMWNGGEIFPLHGFDFKTFDSDPMDEGENIVGHGTGCAGIIVGDGSLEFQTGVAPGCKIMALRVGGGTEPQFWRAFTFALEHGAHIISMSLTWKRNVSPNYPAWRGISRSVLAAGVLHANSSGNEGDQLKDFQIPFNVATPANCPPPWLHPSQLIRGGLASAVACGNVTSQGELFSTSPHGPAEWNEGPFTDYPFDNGALTGLIKPDICAPGQDSITTCFNFPAGLNVKPYRRARGTSNATPQIAGCMALLVQACLRSDRPIMPARIQEALEMTAVPFKGQTHGQKENHFGAGRVDVAAAYVYGCQRCWWA